MTTEQNQDYAELTMSMFKESKFVSDLDIDIPQAQAKLIDMIQTGKFDREFLLALSKGLASDIKKCSSIIENDANPAITQDAAITNKSLLLLQKYVSRFLADTAYANAERIQANYASVLKHSDIKQTDIESKVGVRNSYMKTLANGQVPSLEFLAGFAALTHTSLDALVFSDLSGINTQTTKLISFISRVLRKTNDGSQVWSFNEYTDLKYAELHCVAVVDDNSDSKIVILNSPTSSDTVKLAGKIMTTNLDDSSQLVIIPISDDITNGQSYDLYISYCNNTDSEFPFPTYDLHYLVSSSECDNSLDELTIKLAEAALISCTTRTVSKEAMNIINNYLSMKED